MNSGDQPVIGMADFVNKTGTFILEVPTPRTRCTATLRCARDPTIAPVLVMTPPRPLRPLPLGVSA